MPYYVCPKCGSKDSYSGTEIVSEHKHKSGHMIAGSENELGMTPVMRVGGSSRTEHKELTVRKCRQCDCLLGSKDLRLTEGELKLQREERARLEEEEKRAAEFSNENWWFAIFLGVIVAFIILILWAGN